MKRYGFQLFFHPEGTAGAAGDGKAAAVVAEGTKVDDKGAAAVVDTKVTNPAGGTEEPTADEKAVADKAAADKVVADKAAADLAASKGKSGAPDKYELKVEKDAATFIDADDLKVIEQLARDKGLTNDEAQGIITDRAQALAAQSEYFRTVTEADPTYGGEKTAETARLAKIALDRLRPEGTPRGDAFRRILVKTGYGNNLEIVSLLADLGKTMAEDGTQSGAGGSGGDRASAADKLYDKSKT